MRAVRLIALWGLVVAVAGTVGVGLVTAWQLGRGPAAPAAVPVAGPAGPPVALGSSVAPAMRVALRAAGDDRSRFTVVVENPNARAVAGLRVTTTVDGGDCEWPDGPFPSPFGLAPAAGTARTCQVVHGRSPGGPPDASLTVEVHHGGRRVATATAVAPGPAGTAPGTPAPSPVPAPAAPPEVVGGRVGVGAPAGGSGPAAGADQPPTTAPPCPVATAPAGEVALPTTLDEVAARVADLAGRLDVAACPDWADVSGLRLERGDDAGTCPAWDVHLDHGSTVAAGRLEGGAATGCGPLPLHLEVVDQGTQRAARVATLVAWSLDGNGEAAATRHRAAAAGTATRCDGRIGITMGAAYEQHAAGSRIYRLTLDRC